MANIIYGMAWYLSTSYKKSWDPFEYEAMHLQGEHHNTLVHLASPSQFGFARIKVDEPKSDTSKDIYYCKHF